MLDKPEWKLLVQQLTITLPITDAVSYIISIVKHVIYCILMVLCNSFDSLTITAIVDSFI